MCSGDGSDEALIVTGCAKATATTHMDKNQTTCMEGRDNKQKKNTNSVFVCFMRLFFGGGNHLAKARLELLVGGHTHQQAPEHTTGLPDKEGWT